jgi:hypothetical protein
MGSNIDRSSGRMPQAVRQALIDVFQTKGSMAIADAEAYLSKMEKEGRYKQETFQIKLLTRCVDASIYAINVEKTLPIN